MVEERPSGALVAVDVSAYVGQKIAAMAAHRTQYPLAPDTLPRELLQELLGREYFVRVHPSHVGETSIWPAAFAQRKSRVRVTGTARRSGVPVALA
jgi:LmbE family N-acetylglucosaminyl deacetylase